MAAQAAVESAAVISVPGGDLDAALKMMPRRRRSDATAGTAPTPAGGVPGGQ